MGGSSAPAPAPYGYDAQGNPVSKAERDAWNARIAASGRTSQQEYEYQLARQQSASYADMFATGGAAHAPSGPSGSSYEEIQEQNRITTGQNDLSKAYGNYLDASNSATEYINQQITSQRSNAALLGVDFSITDEQKADRISNYFASIYNESDYAQLKDLSSEFGDAENPLEFLIERGVAVDPSAEAATSTRTPSRGQSTIAGGYLDEEPLAAASSLLGGG